MYLYGASGHGKVIAEIAEECTIKIDAFIDIDMSKRRLLDYDIIHEFPNESFNIIISIGNNQIRKNIVLQYIDLKYTNLLHPKSNISKRARILEGSVVMAGVTINSGAKIGRHSIINTNASVDHDCIIEDFCHISPNASLAGGVIVGEGTHIGIGACIIQGITIGKWCVIGAGAVIIENIPDGATVVGNPGKIVKVKDINGI